MNTTYDTTKDTLNLEKHGVSLVLARKLEWDSAAVWSDTRWDYGEPRQCGIAYIGDRLFVVVFVDRADGRRVISLRKANQREERMYAQT